MLRIQVRIRLNLDLFGRIQILQGAMAVCSAIFHDQSQIGIQVAENPTNLSFLILHLVEALLSRLQV
jgi:hypothetical protein